MQIKNNLKRKIVQIIAFGYSNIHIGNFLNNKIYQGKWKNFCNPGLNCYSCPAASLACPVGAFQSVLTSKQFNFSFYVVGFILAIGVIFGRVVCGFLCPFGLIQELIYKIPTKKFKVFPIFKILKYIILVIFVILLPIFWVDFANQARPTFCMFICPAGTVEAGIPLLIMNKSLHNLIGNMFINKLIILIIVFISCIFIFRFFCKTICPLAVIYGLLNKVSLYGLKVDKEKCINCGKCKNVCKMDINPVINQNSIECIRCGDCREVCQKKAIKIGFGVAKL